MIGKDTTQVVAYPKKKLKKEFEKKAKKNDQKVSERIVELMKIDVAK